MLRDAALTLALAGCLKAGDYRCASATDCGANGQCQPGGHCSFGDATCASGQRYGDLSGAVAGQCVGGGDGGVITDGGGDGPDGASPCPTGYNGLSGGQAGHFYRKISTAADWQTQVSACAADGPHSYLGVPDDNAELSGFRSLAGADVWVGIDDMATPGTYVTVTGILATYLPWGGGQPDAAFHCVEAQKIQNRISTADCTTQLIAICECPP